MIRHLLGCFVAWIWMLSPSTAEDANNLDSQVAQRLLQKYCATCHNAEERKSGIRVDHLDGSFPDERLKLWEVIAKQVEAESMPPEEEPQIPNAQRQELVDWIEQSLEVARSRPAPRNGSIRRLTVTQYRNTLRDLLGLQEDLTDVLPADGVSKHGFTNQPQSLSLSPLLLEAYFDIARQAFDRCTVDTGAPEIQCFQMDLGENINPDPYPDKLILGANSHLLENTDFVVKQVVPEKGFTVQPMAMRTRWRFNEGYQGNATVRGWRDYDSIYHAVFACMRGAPGYPKGRAYTVIPNGLLLRPAVPSNELFQIDSTYGPKANFKISLRELPPQGRFRVTVTAAKYRDGLLIDDSMSIVSETLDNSIVLKNPSPDFTVDLSQSGVYQVTLGVRRNDSVGNPKNANKKQSATIRLQLNDLVVSGDLTQSAFLVARLNEGLLNVSAVIPDSFLLDRVVLTPVPATHELAGAFERFEDRSPFLGVHLGLRRDCGTTMSPVGKPQIVSTADAKQYVFEGVIGNFPSPDVQPDNDNYLAGLRDLGVRCEYTDGRDRPRLLLKSIRFEGPYFESWPSKKHRQLFPTSDTGDDRSARARDWIQSFASVAFRRPVRDEEMNSLYSVWEESYGDHGNYRQAIKDVFTVVMTSPQFLFLIETSPTPEPETLDGFELASKLSYFLWNSPPDNQTLDLAAADALHTSLESEVDRMINDPRFDRFLDEFASQWLALDKLDVVETDRKAYPELTRDVKRELRKEPVEYLKFLIRDNLPASHLVRSDYLVANEVVASYYGFGERVESGFQFVPIQLRDSNLGGLLTQAGILAGLSDGRESNPVKRGAWLARKIIDNPPADPPPNVPTLEDDVSGLSLRQRLELHRNQKGCVNCHLGIDPWGFPFEQYDAGGRWISNAEVDARSTLPDQTTVRGMHDLKRYLGVQEIDQVAFSFAKHLAIYAIGRELAYNEIEQLRAQCLELRSDDYRLRDLIQLVVASDPFLTK